MGIIAIPLHNLKICKLTLKGDYNIIEKCMIYQLIVFTQGFFSRPDYQLRNKLFYFAFVNDLHNILFYFHNSFT